MLPPQNRLTHREIEELKKTKQKIHHGPIRMTIVQSKENTSKIAVYVSSKTDNRASRRNRIKRILYEAFRNILTKQDPHIFMWVEVFGIPNEQTTQDFIKTLMFVLKKPCKGIHED